MMRRFGLVMALLALVGCGAAAPGSSSQGLRQVAASAAGVTLDLLTYNTFGLPAPIGRDLGSRFAAMAAALGGHDVVGLQETFTNEVRQVLEAKIYPYYYRQEKGSLFHPMNSGLTILSRHPIQTVRFHPFKGCATTDCFSRKGVLFTRLDVPGLGPVDVYDTHYQAHAPYTLQRLQDNADLHAFVRENDRGFPTFMLGDFNFVEDEDEYGDLQERLAPLDLFRLHNPDDPGYTSDPANPIGFGSGGEPARIDYVFFLPNRDVTMEILGAQVKLAAQPLSDHYAVHAKVRLTPKAR